MAVPLIIGGGMLFSGVAGYIWKAYTTQGPSSADSIDTHGTNNIIIEEKIESFDVKGNSLIIIMALLLLLKLGVTIFFLYRCCIKKFRNINNKNNVTYRNGESVKICEEA